MAGGLIGGPKPQIQPIAAPQPAAVMPDADSPEAIAARRKAQEKLMNRGGRRSTILTAPGERAQQQQPGDSYDGAKLG